MFLKPQKSWNQQGRRQELSVCQVGNYFDYQDDEYKESVLPKHVKKRLSVEAGINQGWHKYVGSEGDCISLERFGASAPANILFEKFGFTVENIVNKSLELIENK